MFCAKCITYCIVLKKILSYCMGLVPIAQMVECLLRGKGGHEFDPVPRHTKVIKNGNSCSSLGTQTYVVELGLVYPMSG